MRIEQISERRFRLALIALVIAGLLTNWLVAWTYTYNIATPADSESPTLGADRIREVKESIQERLNTDLYFPLESSQVSNAYAGLHRWVTFYGPNTTPSTIPADQGRLYTKTVGTTSELFWIDEDENDLQITSTGHLTLGGGVLANNTWLVAKNAAGTGTVNMLKVGTSDTLVADVNLSMGSHRITDIEDPNLDQDAATKGYVDDVVVARVPAYTGGESFAFGGGLIIKSGYIASTGNATVTFGGGGFTTGLVSVVVTMVRTSGNTLQTPIITAADKTHFHVALGDDGADGYYWIAIGY